MGSAVGRELTTCSFDAVLSHIPNACGKILLSPACSLICGQVNRLILEERRSLSPVRVSHFDSTNARIFATIYPTTSSTCNHKASKGNSLHYQEEKVKSDDKFTYATTGSESLPLLAWRSDDSSVHDYQLCQLTSRYQMFLQKRRPSHPTKFDISDNTNCQDVFSSILLLLRS